MENNLPCENHNVSPYSCVEEPKCGWCQGKRSCVYGTEHGPLNHQSCPLYDNFIFDTPKGRGLFENNLKN